MIAAVNRLRHPKAFRKRKRPHSFLNVAFIYAGNDLLSHTLSRAVQSALRGLTSVFGMGTGGSPAVRSPTTRGAFGCQPRPSAAFPKDALVHIPRLRRCQTSAISTRSGAKARTERLLHATAEAVTSTTPSRPSKLSAER